MSLATPQPADVLLELAWEGGLTRPELAYAFGRVPEFSLLPDGSVYYRDPSWDNAQVMAAHLTSAETDALLQRLLDLGIGRLESYTDQCRPESDSTCLCIADAGQSVLRVRLPGGELREIRNYADFADDPEALSAIRTLLQEYRHPQAEPYTPDKAALFARPLPSSSDLPTLDWPLDLDWLAGGMPDTSCVRAVSGSDLQALLAVTGRNMGDFTFRAGEQGYDVYLVPWLPGVDYADLIASSGQACPDEGGASLQDLIGNLNTELEQREAATFAGLWIQQEPEYSIIVAFTRRGHDTIKKYVDGTPLADLIQVRSAQASLAELIAAEQDANQLVHELGFPFSTAVDVEGNRVQQWVTNRPQFEAALQDTDRQLPERVEVVVVDQPVIQAPAGITPVPDLAFPQLRARSTMHFDLGPLQGKLMIKDGCLRVSQGDDDAGRLIIWQPDYFLNSNQGIIEVLDRDGLVVARVGGQISLTAAGETDWESQLRQPLPKQCPGPTWVMDGIVPK